MLNPTRVPSDRTTTHSAKGERAGADDWTPVDAAERLALATDSLARAMPEFSAAKRLTRAQKWFGCLCAIVVTVVAVAVLVTDGAWAFALPFAITGLLFAGVLAVRVGALVLLATRPLVRHDPLSVTACCDDNSLPMYTILVPLFREAALVGDILASLDALDYPLEKRDIIIALEADDIETRKAVAAHGIGPAGNGAPIAAVVVPKGQPQTKPRALNYAMTFARGRYVVVYDAEDAPEPDQLHRALAEFRSADAHATARMNGDLVTAARPLACVQAQLNTRNPEASWLTRQFTLEYSALFDAVLPLLQWLDWPMPLGGTSNHFDRQHLDAVGGWDPYNVTEDADLGVRLARHKMRCAVVASTTWEEAPPTWSAWFAQRTRWLKGWLQTYLVHMRDPVRLWRELGGFRFIGLQVLMGGMLVSAFVHPWFYGLVGLGWLTGTLPPLFGQSFDSFAFTSGLVMLGLSYVAIVSLGVVTVCRRGRARLGIAAILAPLYWLSISAAAYAAIWQFIRRPFFWAKTPHTPRDEIDTAEQHN